MISRRATTVGTLQPLRSCATMTADEESLARGEMEKVYLLGDPLEPTYEIGKYAI
jgi:hypothetical protein